MQWESGVGIGCVIIQGGEDGIGKMRFKEKMLRKKGRVLSKWIFGKKMSQAEKSGRQGHQSWSIPGVLAEQQGGWCG